MKDTFVFRREWMDAISGLPGEVRLDIYEGIIEYATTGTVPELKQMARLAFCLVKKSIDQDSERYAEISRKRSEAGKKHRGNQYSGAVKMEQNGTNWNKVEQNGTNGSDNDIISTNVDLMSNSNIVSANAEPMPAEPARRGQGLDYEAFMEFYNRTLECSAIPCIKSLSEKRRRMLNARMREHGKEALADVVRKAAASSFLNGGGERAFVADFDWLFRPSNFLKILEGNYDNQTDNYGQPTRQQQQPRRTVYQQQQLDNIAACERHLMETFSKTVEGGAGLHPSLPDHR